MLYRNERAHNLKIEAGNVLNTFSKIREMINANDGTRSFSFRTVDSHDQLPITDSSFLIIIFLKTCGKLIK